GNSRAMCRSTWACVSRQRRTSKSPPRIAPWRRIQARCMDLVGVSLSGSWFGNEPAPMPGELWQVCGSDLAKPQVGVYPKCGPVGLGQGRRDEHAAFVIKGNEEGIKGGIKMGCQ